jgi:hypothetical protein
MATIEIRKDMLNMLIMSFYEVLLDIESVEKIECDSIRIVLDNTFTLKFPARNLPMFLYPQNRYQDIIIPIDNLGNMQIQFLTSKQEITEISEGVSVFDSESMDSFATKPLINLYNNITSEYGEPARTNWSSYKNRLILMENPHKDNKHYSTPAGEMSLIQLYTNAVNTILISHRK